MRTAIKRLYRTYFGGFMSEREKESLRERVMTLPAKDGYPYDLEAKLLRSIGVSPKVMLDVGANTGIYSAILEDKVGSENLYLFEPLPDLHRYLTQRFKKAHVFNFALSRTEGKQKIRVPYIDGARADTRASLNQHVEPNQTGFEEVEIRFSPLDAVARQLNFNAIGFIKIDVEGHELEVIEGGIETLKRFKPLLLIEIETRHHEFPITRIFDRLAGIGYRGFYVDTASFTLRDVAGFDSARDQDQENLKSRNFLRYLNNFFFVHESAASGFVAEVEAFLLAEKRLVEQVSAAAH